MFKVFVKQNWEGVYHCLHCGAKFRLSAANSITTISYCPHCGGKIVGGVSGMPAAAIEFLRKEV